MANNLTLEALQSMTPFHPDGHDKVTEASRSLLLSSIKCEPRIHEVFFPSFPRPLELLVEMKRFHLDVLSTVFVAEAISKTKDPYNFHSLINQCVLTDQLMDVYNSLDWKKLGFYLYTFLYPDVVKDTKTNVGLKDYLGDDGHLWAERLVSYIMAPGWIKSVHQAIVTGRSTEVSYNRDMNALFVKLHLLDPQSVIPAYQFLLSQRALPAVTLELATRNYLGPPLDWGLIQSEIMISEHKPRLPVNASRLSLTSDLDVCYGALVEEFIMTECKEIGLWTGLRANNNKVIKMKDRCQIM